MRNYIFTGLMAVCMIRAHAKHILLINSPKCVTLMMSQVKEALLPGKSKCDLMLSKLYLYFENGKQWTLLCSTTITSGLILHNFKTTLHVIIIIIHSCEHGLFWDLYINCEINGYNNWYCPWRNKCQVPTWDAPLEIASHVNSLFRQRRWYFTEH